MEPEMREELARQAGAVRERAYAPYSKYQVGAALLGQSGRIYTGCNVENAAYPECICAERSAVVKAISEGERRFSAVAVATQDGRGTPCGACRQVLAEFATDADIEVLLVDPAGNITDETTVWALLPRAFHLCGT